MTTKEAYVQKIQARLNAWDSEIEGLKAKAMEANADARIAIEEQIVAVERQQKEAQQKLDELRQANEDAWGDLKAGAESAWMSLGKAVENAAKRFQA